jgi:hypothetical protein
MEMPQDTIISNISQVHAENNVKLLEPDQKVII